MTLQDIKNQVSAINSDFILDTGEQSFIVYPKNYINLIFDQYSIAIGEIVYGRIETYPIFEQIEKVITFLVSLNLDHVYHLSVSSFEFTIYTIDQEYPDYEDMLNFVCDDTDDLLSSIKREVEVLL